MCVLGFATGSILTGSMLICLHDNRLPSPAFGSPFPTVQPLSYCLANFLSLHSCFFFPAVQQFDTFL